MPVIEYNGAQHEFPDSWSDEKIAAALQGEAAAAPSSVMDTLKAIPSGIAKGAAGLVGLPGDIGYGMRAANDWAKGKLGFERDPQYVETGRHKGVPESGVPDLEFTSRDARKAIEGVTGPLYEPKTTAGRYAGSVAEFIPGAIGPGGLARNMTRFAAAPGLAAEGAGDLARAYAPGWEGVAEAAGGLAGFGAASMMRNPQAGERAVSQSLRGVPEPVIRQAEQLVQDAAARGITLTWPEAIQQVTNSGTTLGNLQRVVENSERGGQVMRPIMAERPQQVQQAFDREIGNIAAVPMQPSQIGPRASEAASGVLEGIRRRINTATEPRYQAARADLVPDRTLQRLHRSIPGFTEALRHVRTQGDWAQSLQGLPDNSVIVLDAVKRRMRQTSENMGRATDPDRDLFVASSQERSAQAVDRAARRSSSNYRSAVDEQSARRQRDLEPEQQGIIGQIADAPDTLSAARALLPESPLPNSAAETGRATSLMAGRDLRTTQNLIRTRLEQAFQTAARDTQAGASEFAGAAARKRIYGDRQTRRNIRAAISALPNGPAISAGFERLMNVLEATGRRQRGNSMTEFNRQITRELEGGRGISEAVKPGAAIRERYQQWRLGRNLEDLARLFTDPTAARRLIELSRMRYADPRMTTIIAELATDFAEGAQ